MNRQKTQGLIAAPFTPMRADGRLNLTIVADYAQWLHSSGVVGAFICGTTGEGSSLTQEERRKLAERWVAVAPTGLRVIVHVGYGTLTEGRALATHAAAIGADSIACMAPSLLKSKGLADLVGWCLQIASAAPRLPFYLYHMPSVTGVDVKVADFFSAAGEIPNLAGVKYTFEDLEDFARCIRFGDGRYDTLFGRDELLLSALKLGARAAVGSTYNFAAPLYYRLIEAFERGDEPTAAALQAQAVGMIEACANCSPHPIAAFKWLMRQVAIDCGPVRPPLVDLTAEQISSLEAALANAGSFAYLKRRSKTGSQELVP